MHLQRRSENREYCSIRVEYALVSDDRDSRDCGPWVNVTSDISVSGMGIFSERPIPRGKKMHIYLRHVSREPRSARAVWCMRVDSGLYRVGLRYCQASEPVVPSPI
jgi:c-di-GMP-binding flagellar brake protein YcgR